MRGILAEVQFFRWVLRKHNSSKIAVRSCIGYLAILGETDHWNNLPPALLILCQGKADDPGVLILTIFAVPTNPHILRGRDDLNDLVQGKPPLY